MRARFVLLGFSGFLFTAGAAVQACGGDSSPSAPSDAGADAPVDTGPADSAPEAAADASPCDTSADFTESIPDASIADGASTTGICLGCAKTNCSAQIDACNKDCPCQGVADDALDCYSKSGGDPLACAGEFGNVPPKTQQIGIQLFGCIQRSCKKECAADSFDAGDAQ